MKVPQLLIVSLLACRLASAATDEPPKLVVGIVVDQLRYDYLERFHDQFAEGGFKLLTDKGAFLTFAHYNYMPTVTGPGHASVYSGAPPAVHGIIGNDWLDKRTQKRINCVSDPDVEGVGASPSGGKRSPRNFVGSTFADEFRLRYGGKVVGISHKDRGAILPAGKKPTGAYWLESSSGNFITSTYYRHDLPDWVQEFNERRLPATYIGQIWKRLLDPKEYAWPDNAAGEGLMSGEETPTFDHTIVASKAENFEAIVPTPFANQLLTEFAIAALEGEQLGTGPQPDMLSISYSSVDAAGHRYGPYSQEIQDMVLRLDRDLAKLFSYLDKKIGLANVMIMLSADHGIAPTPEFAAEQGLDGQRLDLVPLVGDLLAKMSERFGPNRFLLPPRIIDGSIHFNHQALLAAHIPAETVANFIRDWALSTGYFQAVYSRDQILDGRATGPLGQRVINGYNAERSGDVVFVYKPFIIPTGSKTGTTHGSPYSYDTHIPVLFYGSQFNPGRYADEFYITDIAATMSAALRMNAPSGSIGKPLVNLLRDQGPALPSAPVNLPATTKAGNSSKRPLHADR